MEINIETVKKVLRERDLILVDTVGKGSYSTAFTVKSIRYGSMLFVAKVIYSPNKDSSSLNDAYMRELETLKGLAHPYVIQLYDAFKTDDNMLYIILEYCEQGTLMDMIIKDGPLNRTQLVDICQQILKGISYIHSQNVAHRDIKPENIFMTYKKTIKIADFGFSSFVENGQKVDDFRGSIGYCSPEILKQNVHDLFKADIWALGVTFYIMALGQHPFPKSSNTVLRHSIETGMFIIPKQLDADMADLIKKMIVVDPQQRLSADELLRHPFFNSKKTFSAASHPLQDVSLFGNSSKNLRKGLNQVMPRTTNKHPRILQRHSYLTFSDFRTFKE